MTFDHWGDEWYLLNFTQRVCMWSLPWRKMGAMASQITSLTIVYSSVYSGADQRNIKALRHLPLCGEFTGHRWIFRTKGQKRGNVSIWWRHHVERVLCGYIMHNFAVIKCYMILAKLNLSFQWNQTPCFVPQLLCGCNVFRCLGRDLSGAQCTHSSLNACCNNTIYALPYIRCIVKSLFVFVNRIHRWLSLRLSGSHIMF